MPAPLILALLLNELWSTRYKRVVQSISYLPHFLSWVVIAGLFRDILSPNGGAINQFLGLFGVKPILFLGDNRYFRSILIFTDIWRDSGWGAIVYLAAIAGINPELYEAAIIDGAKKMESDMAYNTTLYQLDHCNSINPQNGRNHGCGHRTYTYVLQRGGI